MIKTICETKNNKVIAIGDSIMAGVVLENNKYRYFNKRWLQDITALKNVEITNCAKFGQTSGRALKMASELLEHNHDYQTAIIELGGNDCNFNWPLIASNPDDEHLPITALHEFAFNITKLIELCLSKGLKVLIVNLPPIDANKYFNHISHSLNGDNIKYWLKNIDVIYRIHESYNNKLVEIAGMYNVKVLRVREELLKIRDYSNYLCDDGLHLNVDGYQILSSIIEQIV